MWVILRGSDHSRHALLIMLCISAVHLNRELATTQCLHCSSPLLWCSQGRGKKVASGLSDLISSLMAWKDFIEVQIDCVPMQVVDWGQKLMPVKMPWLNSILLAPYSLSLLTLGSIIRYQLRLWNKKQKTRDKTSWFWLKSGQTELQDVLPFTATFPIHVCFCNQIFDCVKKTKMHYFILNHVFGNASIAGLIDRRPNLFLFYACTHSWENVPCSVNSWWHTLKSRSGLGPAVSPFAMEWARFDLIKINYISPLQKMPLEECHTVALWSLGRLASSLCQSAGSRRWKPLAMFSCWSGHRSK